MPVTVTWDVVKMDCFSQAQGQVDVITTVHWGAMADDGVNRYCRNGAVTIAPYVAGNPFTPYTEVTVAQALGWAYAAMGAAKTAQEAEMAAVLATMPNPPIVTKELPWR